MISMQSKDLKHRIANKSCRVIHEDKGTNFPK